MVKDLKVKAIEHRAVIAKELYEAYCEDTDWKSLATGQDLPEWENLPPAIQRAWKAVAVKAMYLGN
jgi:hypothetical protein